MNKNLKSINLEDPPEYHVPYSGSIPVLRVEKDFIIKKHLEIINKEIQTIKIKRNIKEF
jgi:hypothetical protein